MSLKTLLQAIHDGLEQEMDRDDRVFILGEDVGKMGGAFKVTEGLYQQFGDKRVRDTPISESAIVGYAIGAALMGMRPVAEMQFMDFISCGFDQIVNQAATMAYRYGGETGVPMVVRGPSGAFGGGGLFHSQSPEAWFTHAPGLKVVVPATPYDAKGLMVSAIRDNNPVIYFEHKYLYRNLKEDIPDEIYEVPLGKADIKRVGDDITIITYGLMVHHSQQAAQQLETEDGLSVEIVDLRTLSPLDRETIFESVKKTNRVLLVQEDKYTGGIMSDVSAQITENLFDQLDAPIMRVTAPDTPVPYAPTLEQFYMPNKDKIIAAARKLAAY
ncbi:MAG TPA: alpha-ketoacid dehydrogenase subunit beta [Capsulimonadaceae bacterium]|nr:alpha-ketoacid dehydrogenase subunit beta [Capsulimonadaceae bacterium]